MSPRHSLLPDSLPSRSNRGVKDSEVPFVGLRGNPGRWVAVAFQRPAQGFTLGELLVVLAIMASLLGVLAPSIGSIGKASGLNNAGNLLLELANNARQNSLAKNAMTALVCVTDSSANSHPQLFTMLELSCPKDSSTAQALSEWKQISKWQPLVSGIVVSKWSTQLPNVSPSLPTLRYGEETLSQGQVSAVIFLPDGSTLNDSPTTIQLAEGYIPKGSSSPSITGPRLNGEPANYYAFTILKATGRIKVVRR
ncbi:MAG: Tfp pilus assembly protein FimT/FimU [Chthoniobacteraceae bacterium]